MPSVQVLLKSYLCDPMQAIEKALNRQLELTIMPTERCNLNCVYCPEEFHEGNMMQQDVIASIKKFLEVRVPEIDRLKVSWFGGEPLLAYATVVDLMGHINHLISANPGVRMTSDISTNATLLTKSRLVELTALGVKHYQISFDGDKEEHDKLRQKRGKTGTFDLIWKNLIGAHDSACDFSVMVRMHANSENENSLRLLLKKLSHELGGDQRFNIYIRKLARWGSKNDNQLPILEDAGAVSRLRNAAKELGLLVREDEGEFVCYAAKPFAYVIRASGLVNKCTLYLKREENSIGGLLRDGRMSLNPDLALMWSRGMLSGSKEELECPAINFPKLSLKASGMIRSDKLRVIN